MSVLGAIMLDAHSLVVMEQFISPDDFPTWATHEIITSILALRDRGATLDEVSVCYELQNRGTLVDVGGPLFVSRLAERCVSPVLVESHSRILRSSAARRNLALITRDIASAAGKGAITIDEAAARITEIKNDDTQRERTTADVVRKVLVDLEERQKHPGQLLGVSSGYADIDRYTSGWQRGDLIILAARPSMGKTALALNFVAAAMRNGKRPMVFSLEMSGEQLTQRMLAMGGVDANRIKSGDFRGDDWSRMSRTVGQLVSSSLVIVDGGSMTVQKICARVRSSQQAKPVDLVVIDYLQLMSGTSSNKEKNREREVAEISRALKLLAGEMKIPIIALSQLNRGVETRANKRPGLADLRESGAIEQDADVVAFLYRDEVYDADTKDKGIAEIIFAKQRNGETGVARLQFTGAFQRFDAVRS